MNENIRELIGAAGFSSTYEVDRLTHLCKLSALQCVEMLLQSENIPNAVANIYKRFDLENEDDTTE